MIPYDSSNEDLMVYNAVMHNTPKGIECSVYWTDAPEAYEVKYISFGAPMIHEDDVICDEFLVDDEYIFYYLDSEEVAKLLEAIERGATYFDCGQEWTIELTQPFDVIYHDSSTPTVSN